jgi:UDP-galactopyranose mutase
MKYAIVGAGFTGSVLARELAEQGHEIFLYDSRAHVAGNCFTERDKETGILVHKYGPHIFHTDNDDVWSYVRKFGEFLPYINRVKTTTQGAVYSLPINLHTINQYFKKTFSPLEAKRYIEDQGDKSILIPVSFEDQAMKFIGKDLYEAFFKGYTIKQWGVSPSELPASILKRLPVRFNYDDNYFNHKYQGMPKDGYTSIVENILDHSSISVFLNEMFDKSTVNNFDHVFYSGPLDGWFDYKFGRLGYRTLDFEKEIMEGDFQGCAVMNYGDEDIPFTRISEHKHFSPWEEHSKTIIFREKSRQSGDDDEPYYPIRLLNDKAKLKVYIDAAKKEQGVSFLGRLGTYRYLDMDVTIKEALDASKTVIVCASQNKTIPSFFVDEAL